MCESVICACEISAYASIRVCVWYGCKSTSIKGAGEEMRMCASVMCVCEMYVHMHLSVFACGMGVNPRA